MSIVNLVISTTNPPTPSKLLQSGVIVSNGGTLLNAGEVRAISSADSAKNLILQEQQMSAITWANGTVTVSFAQSLPGAYGQTTQVQVSGVTPAAYNGIYEATVVSGSNQITYELADNPGAATVMGTVISMTSKKLSEQIEAFWGQGKSRSVFILELGAMSTDDAAKELQKFINQDISSGLAYQKYFLYLVPEAWADSATFVGVTGKYTATQDMVYFWVPVNADTAQAWENVTYKSVIPVLISPDADSSECPAANAFQSALANDPGSSNKVPPMSYRFMFGVTAYPPAGNGEVLQEYKDKNISYIAEAAEGGLSNKMLVMGHCLDGMPFGYWYAIAWTGVNLVRALANEVINGSNTTLNPLYYEQSGINRLQRRALQTLRSGVSYGLILGRVFGVQYTQDDFIIELDKGTFAGEAVINAVPFREYNSLNPDDFGNGFYGGLSAVMTPRRGFESITFNLNVTNFVGA